MSNELAKTHKNFLIYQPFLEKSFVMYLTENGASVKTKANYRTDLRHFFMWMQLSVIKSSSIVADSHVGYLSIISSDLLAAYRQFLLEKNIPVGTINRRLSTLRSFLRCCKKNGWINSNAQIEIFNVKTSKTNGITDSETWFSRLVQWERQLEKQGASKSTVKNYMRDVESFLHWFHAKNKP